LVIINDSSNRLAGAGDLTGSDYRQCRHGTGHFCVGWLSFYLYGKLKVNFKTLIASDGP
jgi:hypothetical protein